MARLFHGRLERDTVIVDDEAEASALYNRSSTGWMRKGKLELSLVEAFYLMNEGKLEMEGGKEKLLESALSLPGFQTRYMVYRELRKRGFLIRDDGFMYIWRGGEQKEKGEMKVYPLDEKSVFSFDEVYSMASEIPGYSGEDFQVQMDEHKDGAGKTEGAGKQRPVEPLIFAIVDGDGDVTYYTIDRYHPKGPHNRGIKGIYGALLMDDMGIMTGDYREIHSLFYGKKMDDILYLSALECAHLMEKGALTLYERGTPHRSPSRVAGDGRSGDIPYEDFLSRMREKDPEMTHKLRIYSDLRDRGLIVRTGFKYGTHFRVYVKDVEQHAKYLAHAIPEGYKGSWPEISRGVRLAHGVKKDFLLAEASDPPRYLRIKRVRL